MFQPKNDGKCPITGVKMTPMYEGPDNSFIRIHWENGKPQYEVQGMNIEGLKRYADIPTAIISLVTEAALTHQQEAWAESQRTAQIIQRDRPHPGELGPQ